MDFTLPLTRSKSRRAGWIMTGLVVFLEQPFGDRSLELLE